MKEESDKKVRRLEGQCGDLQSVVQQLSDDFQKVEFEKLSVLCTLWASSPKLAGTEREQQNTV